MSVRIDRYVWFVRLAKTRTKAAEQINKGKIKLNGENVKPAAMVKIGDVIGVVKHSSVFTYKVKEYLDRRVGAKLVDNYIIDTTPEEEIEKFKTYRIAQSSYRKHGTGKPTKKERRELERFLGWDDFELDKD